MNFFNRVHETRITRTGLNAIFPLPNPARAALAQRAAERAVARAAVIEVLG